MPAKGEEEGVFLVTAQATGHDPLIGQALGHYRIVEKIGAGGMGAVYRAHDEHLDREIAVKVIHPRTVLDEHARKLLHKEAVALSKLNHPNIATIYDFDTQQGLDFLAMEYVSGTTLSQRLGVSSLSEKEVVALGLQIAEALEDAHEHGIIHRDLKPANVAITAKGNAKVLDFGLAKMFDPARGALVAETVTQSVDDFQLAGTLPYMAPEQVTGAHIDPRTDIFAMGAVLYEMATQQRAFCRESTAQVFASILHQKVIAPRELNPQITAEMERIILKCMEKGPENRYQSAKELAVDLRRLGAPSASVPSTAMPRAARSWVRKTVVYVGMTAMVAVGVVGMLFFRSRSAQALTIHDTVVLGDFVNTTDDPVFDDALKTAFAVELGQSPFLNILSDQKVSATLRMMGRGTNERIAGEVGREVCLRAGSKALLSGTISRLGNHYVLGLEAVACGTGDSLAKEQGEAASKEDVLKVLSRTSSRLRNKLGESLPSVQKFDVPMEATTSSLEALKSCSIGARVGREKGDAPSIPFYKRAIELDPNFPGAYAGLAIAYSNLRQPSLALEYATKAYQLRDRVTEREKMRICATYFGATGEVEKEAQTYEMWLANYPRDWGPHANLSVNYVSMGQYDRALVESQEALRLAPKDVLNYVNLGETYLDLYRLDEAKATFDQALAHKLDGGGLRGGMYYLAFLREDSPQMEEEVAWGTGKPGDEDPLLSMWSDTEAYYGRLKKSRDVSQRAVDSAVRADSNEAAASWHVNAALREAELGNSAFARQGVTAALALSPGRDVKVLGALALARIGESPRAKALVEELARKYPTNTMLQLYWLPTINAAIALNKRNSSEAIAFLEGAAPYELGTPQELQVGTLYPAYLRGKAYLLARNGTAAAAEFRKILDHKGIVVNFVTGALAHREIARAYAMAGDTTKAKAAYQDFFALWKDADSDISILKEAKAEFAKLQ